MTDVLACREAEPTARADTSVKGKHWRRGVLKGGTVIPAEHDAITITRSLPHGHVAAALGTARKIGLDRILGPDGGRCRDLALALLLNRILEPWSKLAAARALSPATASSTKLYVALDWLLKRQSAIETALAKRHLTDTQDQAVSRDRHPLREDRAQLPGRRSPRRQRRLT